MRERPPVQVPEPELEPGEAGNPLAGLWYLGSTIRSIAILAAAAVSPWLVAEHLTPVSDMNWVPWTAATMFTFAMGLTLRRHRTLIELLALPETWHCSTS